MSIPWGYTAWAFIAGLPSAWAWGMWAISVNKKHAWKSALWDGLLIVPLILVLITLWSQSVDAAAGVGGLCVVGRENFGVLCWHVTTSVYVVLA